MIEVMKVLNTDFAAVLSCIISLVTAVTTIVYVVFTYRQVKATQDSVRLMQAEMKQEKQPCLIVSINRVYSGSADALNGRRWMPVEFRLENISDTPALSIFAISHLELQSLHASGGKKNVNMFSGPLFIPYLKAGISKKGHLHYENEQIDLMFKDLMICMKKNWKRLATNPYQSAYRGTELVIQVFYKNLNGQWFESKLIREVGWAFDETTKKKTKNNLNEFTFPPREITAGDSFELQMVSPYLSPLQVHMVNREEVDKALSPYKEDWPDVFRAET